MLQTLPVAEARAIRLTTHILTSLIRPPQKQDFAVRLWDGQLLPPEAGREPRFTLVLTHPGALRRMFLPPGELTLAEAYLRGDFEVEGDLAATIEAAAAWQTFTAMDWARLTRQVLALPNTDPARAHLTGWQHARLHGARHSRARARAVVNYHYNVGNDFYQLFLGPWMMYSSAYYPSQPLDLARAQVAQLEYICRKLELKPGDRLLDIGCGWGGLLVYAAQNYRVQATGITLSQPQADYARAWIERAGLSDRARVELRDYRDLDRSQSFDKASSIEMVGHVGRAHLPEFFASVSAVLCPGGLLLIQDIAPSRDRKPNPLERVVAQRLQFGQRYFLPDVEPVPIGELLARAEQGGFEARDIENVREHYPPTLRHWLHGLEAHHAEAVRLTDERTYRTWRLFLAASVYGFASGHARLYQTVLAKGPGAAIQLPLTRAHLYRNPEDGP